MSCMYEDREVHFVQVFLLVMANAPALGEVGRRAPRLLID